MNIYYLLRVDDEKEDRFMKNYIVQEYCPVFGDDFTIIGHQWRDTSYQSDFIEVGEWDLAYCNETFAGRTFRLHANVN